MNISNDYIFWFIISLGIVSVIVRYVYLSKRESLSNNSININLPDSFTDYYTKYIEALNTLIEQKRLAYLKKLKYRILIFLCVLTVNVSFVSILQDSINTTNPALTRFAHTIISFETNWFRITFILYLIFISWVIMPIFSYKAALKNEIYPKILGFFGKDISYRYKGGFKANKFSGSVIIPNTFIQIKRDEISGYYNQVEFNASWWLLQNPAYFLMPSSSWLDFLGVIIEFDVKEKFSGTTVVKKFGTSVVGLELVNLPDSKFLDTFVVFSNNPDEAKRLVTNNFLENLQEMRKSLTANYIEASFYDQKLLLKISLDDRFLFFKTNSLFSKCDLWDASKQVMQRMLLLFNSIDKLS